MSKAFNALILLSLVLASPLSLSPAIAGGGCPAFIGNKITKQMVSGKNLVCSSSKIKGLKLGNVVSSGQVKLQNSFTMDGSADAQSPAFQVGKNGATVEYSFDDSTGKGGLKIDLVDLNTGKRVDTLLNSRGGVDSTTSYLSQAGVYYLKISVKQPGQVCTNEDGFKSCEVITATYSITVDNGSGGDDFSFDFGF